MSGLGFNQSVGVGVLGVSTVASQKLSAQPLSDNQTPALNRNQMF